MFTILDLLLPFASVIQLYLQNVKTVTEIMMISHEGAEFLTIPVLHFRLSWAVLSQSQRHFENSAIILIHVTVDFAERQITE